MARFRDSVLATWQTNNRVTAFFVENLPSELWSMKLPGSSQKTIRMIAGHIHNARCMWIKMIGRRYGIKPPRSVDRRRVTKKQLLAALKHSNQGVLRLLEEGLEHDGTLEIRVPWSNIPSDVVHFMTYLAAHEAHHRGQVVLAARELGHRLPSSFTAGLWQWKKLSGRATKR